MKNALIGLILATVVITPIVIYVQSQNKLDSTEPVAPKTTEKPSTVIYNESDPNYQQQTQQAQDAKTGSSTQSSGKTTVANSSSSKDRRSSNTSSTNVTNINIRSGSSNSSSSTSSTRNDTPLPKAAFSNEYIKPSEDLAAYQDNNAAIQIINQSSNPSAETLAAELPPEDTPIVINPTTVDGAVDSNVEITLTPEETNTPTIDPSTINAEASIEEAVISEDFDFDIYEDQTINIISRRENGEIYPFAKFNIETDGGDIISQKYTDKDGVYTGKVSTLNQQKLYIRFTTTGLSAERISIN